MLKAVEQASLLLLLYLHSQGDTPWTLHECYFTVVISITIEIQEETPGDPRCIVVGKGAGSYNVFNFKAMLSKELGLRQISLLLLLHFYSQVGMPWTLRKYYLQWKLVLR